MSAFDALVAAITARLGPPAHTRPSRFCQRRAVWEHAVTREDGWSRYHANVDVIDEERGVTMSFGRSLSQRGIRAEEVIVAPSAALLARIRARGETPPTPRDAAWLLSALRARPDLVFAMPSVAVECAVAVMADESIPLPGESA